MATEWYYARGGQQKGPISPSELKRLAKNGELLPTDLVWKDGMPEWKPASQIQGLIPAQAPAATVPIIDTGIPSRRRHSRSIVGLMLLCFTSIAMIAAACVPWWSMSFRARDDGEQGGYWMRRDSLTRQAALLSVIPRGNRNGTRPTPKVRLRNAKDDKGNWATRIAVYMKASERNLKNYRKAIDECEVDSDDSDADDVRRDALNFFKAAENSKKWWDKHLKTGEEKYEDRFYDLARDVDRDERMSLTIRIWGLSDGRGVMALVFGIVIFLLSIVFMAVPILRNWGWIISLIATVMGILALTLALIWIMDAPGEDVGSMFRQGVSIGPWILLGAGALYLLIGMVDAIFGVSFLVRRMRSRSIG